MSNVNDSDEIIGMLPYRIKVLSVLVYFTVLVAIVFVCFIIKFHHSIKIEVNLLPNSIHKEIFAKQGGYIDSVYISNNSVVKKDSLILRMKAKLDYAHLSGLESLIKNEDFRSNILRYVKELQVYNSDHLGDLQNDLEALIDACSKYINYMSYHTYELEIAELKEKIYRNNKQLRYIDSCHLVNGSYYEDNANGSSLFNRSNIESEVRQSNFSIQILENDYKRKKAEYELSIIQKNNNLIRRIQSCKDIYEVKSPIDGKVFFSAEVIMGSRVESEMHLASIIPLEDSINIVGYALIPAEDAEQVRVGQVVKLEYEGLKGYICDISMMANNTRMIKISFPNYGKIVDDIELNYIPQMNSKGEIFIEDDNIIGKFFH